MLPVYYTGIRDGEYITSAPGAIQNKGTIIQFKGEYPPSKLAIDNLELTDYRDKLDKIEFFHEMTLKERKQWLQEHATNNKDLYISDLPVKIRFVTIQGKDMIARTTEAQRTELTDGRYIKIKEATRLLGKPGSTATRPTLIFRPGDWVVVPAQVEVEHFKGVLVSVYGSAEQYSGGLKGILALIGNDIVVQAPDEPGYTPQDIEQILNVYPDSPRVIQLLGWASPSIHKSLIQKVIRTRCNQVTFLDEVFNGTDVLVTSFLMLVQHPGIFDPEMKNFITGLESATKRLGVTIAEDSHVEDPSDLLCLFASGYCAKVNKRWRPSIRLIKKWIDIALEAHINIGIYLYKFDPIDIPINTDPLGLAYHLLVATKALRQDLPMVGWIAKNKGKLNKEYNQEANVNIPLVHCIDQHNLTDIAWHVPYKHLTSYPQFLRQVWTKSSSINGRKGNFPEGFEDTPFVKRLRRAQYEVWFLHMDGKEKRVELDKVIELEYTLEETWIAGLVGVISTKVNKRQVQVVIDTHDIYNFITVVKPARGEDKVHVLTYEERASVIKIAKGILKKGIKVKVPGSLKGIFERITIQLVKGEWEINGEPWEDVRHLSIELPIHAPIKRDTISACFYTGTGVEVDYEESITELVNQLNAASKDRLLTYIDTVVSRILLYKIDRGGESVGYTVAIEDTAVYQFLSKLSVIVPVAIEPDAQGFTIKHGPVMWMLVDIIKDIISTTTVEQASKWKLPVPDKRVLYQHQRDALRMMRTGGNRHLIYITAGLGKTLIFIRYIMNLIKLDKMPTYCVYTLPTSAYDGVVKQFHSYQMKTNLLNMNKKDGNYRIKPYVINFIYHDHMREGTFLEDAGRVANQLVFIVDEFHLTFNKTKRTTAALSLAKVAKYFVGMTGTMIKDNNPEDLIQWLALISKFEVTKDNYWVAIGSVIANRIETKISVNRIDIHLELTKEQQIRHSQSFQEAVKVCYEVVLGGIVEQAFDYINKGEGVFIVAKDVAMQDKIELLLGKKGVKRIYKITASTPITYEPGDKRKLQAIITTVRHNTGYTITGMHTMITSVWFSNQATRDQLNARLNRIGQPSDFITIVTLHAGLLSYVLERYERVRTLAEAMKSFAAIADVNPNEL